MNEQSMSSIEHDEDWTKIEDQRARKKVQNRIAQRNYRKNLRLRIQELERQNMLMAQPIYLPNVITPPELNYGDYLSLHQQQPPVLELPKAPQSVHGPQHYLSEIHEDPVAHESFTSMNLSSLSGSYFPPNKSLDNYYYTLDSQDIGNQDQINTSPSSANLTELLIEELSIESLISVPPTSPWLDASNSPSSHMEENQVLQLKDDCNAAGGVISLDRGLKSTKTIMEERLGQVLTECRTAGFPNFDTAVATYYTARFQSGSAMDQAQRVSRRCYLPGVLTALGKGLQEWPKIESQGFVSQILAINKAILVEECRANAAREFMQEILPDLMVRSEIDDFDSTAHTLHRSHVKREFIRAFPSLSSFITDLMGKDNGSGLKDSSAMIFKLLTIAEEDIQDI